MKIRNIIFTIAAFAAMALAAACDDPQQVVVYGKLYTDKTHQVPAGDVTLSFSSTENGISGVTKTDAAGLFAFAFWTDGTHAERSGLKALDSPELLIMHSRDTLFEGDYWDHTQDNAIVISLDTCYRWRKGGAE